jgi:hypothetical protein
MTSQFFRDVIKSPQVHQGKVITIYIEHCPSMPDNIKQGYKFSDRVEVSENTFEIDGLGELTQNSLSSLFLNNPINIGNSLKIDIVVKNGQIFIVGNPTIVNKLLCKDGIPLLDESNPNIPNNDNKIAKRNVAPFISSDDSKIGARQTQNYNKEGRNIGEIIRPGQVPVKPASFDPFSHVDESQYHENAKVGATVTIPNKLSSLQTVIINLISQLKKNIDSVKSREPSELAILKPIYTELSNNLNILAQRYQVKTQEIYAIKTSISSLNSDLIRGNWLNPKNWTTNIANTLNEKKEEYITALDNLSNFVENLDPKDEWRGGHSKTKRQRRHSKKMRTRRMK